VLSVGSLSVAGNVDLGDNKLITSTPVGSWSGSSYDGVTGMIASGRNGGSWDGSGITQSASSAGNDHTTLGVARASQVLGISDGEQGTWAGKEVNGSDTLAMYTYGGDANLDGKIDILDYGQIDFNVAGGAATGWYNGDFNYDGKINILDYGIIDFNVGAQGAAISSGGVAAVPEPGAAIGLMAWALLGLARPRRSRSK
jgi:hypothetical protein